jgi:prolyl 4-hydroxylase
VRIHRIHAVAMGGCDRARGSARRTRLGVVFAVVVFACASFACANAVEEEPRLIGWMGEVPRPTKGAASATTTTTTTTTTKMTATAAKSGATTANLERTQEGRTKIEGESWVEQLSATPRVYLYHNFLTDEECEHLISLGEDRLERSTVVGQGEKGYTSNVRTSDGTFIARRLTPTLSAVEDRVAEYSGIPWTHQEELQLLRYQNGQEYVAHSDGIDSGKNGGKRIATVLMFLREPEWGGETNFPDADPFPDVKQAFLKSKSEFSECGWQNGLGFSVKPRRGDAILFYSFHINGTEDNLSMHASCPTLKGTKYTATKWIHENIFDTPTWVKPTCVDTNDKCEEWAQNGECERNPAYMIGIDAVGSCSKSCCEVMDRMELTMTQRRICEPCDKGEKATTA